MEDLMTEQELLAVNVKNAELRLKVMQDLDKIKTPLEVTIYQNNQRSTYRNDAYRKMVAEMDSTHKETLKQFVKEQSTTLMEKLFKRNGR